MHLLAKFTDLQFRSPGYGWWKNEKKKNAGNCNALCVSRKHNNNKDNTNHIKSSHPKLFCKKGVEKVSQNSQENT